MTHRQDATPGEAIAWVVVCVLTIAALAYMLMGCGTTGKDAMHAGVKFSADLGRKALDEKCIPGEWSRAKCAMVLTCAARFGESVGHDAIDKAWTPHSEAALKKCALAGAEWLRVTQ